MTQSSLQTECPKCHTRFRVTDEQLGIAKGKVRCGHCMDVFNALEHKVATGTGSRPEAPSDAPPEKSSEGISPDQPATGFESDILDDDFIFADNPEEDAEEGRYAGTKLTFSDDELSDSFRNFDDRDNAALEQADDNQLAEDVDESWAEAMLSEDSKPAIAADTPPEAEEPPAREAPEQKREAVEQPASEPEEFMASEDEGLEEPEEPAREPDAGTLFTDLRYEPLAAGNGKRNWPGTLLWIVVVLGLAGALIAQITWFQFDRLSAIPELRPFYEKGCELAGCELKPLIDVDAIQSRKLVVRTDPQNRNQLVVDAVIINRANFQQPFPAIALTFSNLNGDVVAHSIFAPADYLAGEAEQLDIMPVDTPVRIAISIRDPGRDAVNYNIVFRPHTP